MGSQTPISRRICVELAEMLLRSHKPAGCKLTLNVPADRVPLNLDQSILLSLIANELLLNSLKHAFQRPRCWKG